MIGQTVGNYEVVSLLGEGGMGVVYLAQHPAIGRKAAVKVLHPALAQNQDVILRFFNEARAANAIRHPGIVEVFDLGTLPSGAPYIVMEFLDGESLASRIRRVGRLGVGDAVDIAGQATGVLGAAHAKGIVHRDLKPDNLFLVPDSQIPGHELVKVLDFGIAKLSQKSAGAGAVKTRTGTIMGTPLYMSPEQCRGTREVDHRADIYSLGIILFELLCGEPPFVSAGHGELIHMHIATPPPSARARNPEVSEALEQVIMTCLAKEPGGRYSSMADLAAVLKGKAARPDSRTTPYAVAQPRSAARPPGASSTTFSRSVGMIDDKPAVAPAPRRWWLWASGAALVIAAVAGGATVIGGKTEGKTGHTKGDPLPVGEPVVALHSAAAAAVAPPADPGPATAQTMPKAIFVGISSTPGGARVVREKDGADIGVTPFRESWPAGDGVEKVRLELHGFSDEALVVPLDRGVNLNVALRANAAPTARRKKPGEAPRVGRTPAAPPPPARDEAPPAAPKPARSEPVPL